MKKMKNRKGFTLVELIVVIAILAILAGIAIPVYSNYIKKANEAADLQQLDAIKTAVAFAATDKALPGSATLKSITVTVSSGAVSAITYELKEDTEVSPAPTHATKDEITAYTGALNNFKSDTFKTTAYWSAASATWGNTVPSGD